MNIVKVSANHFTFKEEDDARKQVKHAPSTEDSLHEAKQRGV